MRPFAPSPKFQHFALLLVLILSLPSCTLEDGQTDAPAALPTPHSVSLSVPNFSAQRGLAGTKGRLTLLMAQNGALTQTDPRDFALTIEDRPWPLFLDDRAEATVARYGSLLSKPAPGTQAIGQAIQITQETNLVQIRYVLEYDSGTRRLAELLTIQPKRPVAIKVQAPETATATLEFSVNLDANLDAEPIPANALTPTPQSPSARAVLRPGHILTLRHTRAVDSQPYTRPEPPAEAVLALDTEYAPDAKAANAFLERLQLGVGPDALGPFGSTHQRFNGHVFWDADVWVFPALALLDPRTARHIPDFRLRTLPAAQANFQAWAKAGYPTAKETRHTPLPELTRLLPRVKPALYPWEARPDGSEGSPSDTRHQHHVTGAVALMLDKAAALGLADPRQTETAIQAAAAFYLHRLTRNPDGTYGIINTVSPSEWHTASNDLYTNAIADAVIRRALGPQAWPPGKIRLPRRQIPNGKYLFATFDNDDFDRYQQAAAILTVFPLQDPRAVAEAALLLDFYADKTAPEGPAMSRSVHATVAARLGQTERALEEWRQSFRIYSANPQIEFREKPKNEPSYFLTGAAGCLNTVLYGFLGIHIASTPPPTLTPETPTLTLDTRYTLYVIPNLPSSWKSARARLVVQGKTYILTVTRQPSGKSTASLNPAP